LAALADGALLIYLLRRHLNGIDGAQLAVTFVKVTLASIVMALVAGAVERVATAMLPGVSFGVQTARLVLEIGCGLAGLAVAARLLRIREFGDATAQLRARFSRSR